MLSLPVGTCTDYYIENMFGQHILGYFFIKILRKRLQKEFACGMVIWANIGS
jgi:hypothetical protein